MNSIFPARVCGIMNESMTVKRLRLAVPSSDFTFKAGQWVDFFIPGVEKVGGFSICSSPGLLQREGVIELAVKYSQHAPAYWIHKECAVDSEVAVRVGGDFFFDPQPSDLPVDLLLVAGGVGINPLYSILLHMVDLLRGRRSRPDAYEPKSVRLCYSAKNPQELLFKKTIAEVCQEFPGKVSCDFHVTQDSEDVDPQLRPLIRKGRISEEVLKEHLRGRDTLCYLCGPPPMIESVSEQLLHLGLSQDTLIGWPFLIGFTSFIVPDPDPRALINRTVWGGPSLFMDFIEADQYGSVKFLLDAIWARGMDEGVYSSQNKALLVKVLQLR
ncbi:oxidoreductase NAD-binding domain-containing protein 1-like, partial [Scleropages formosus]